ncbi:hypothetical protein U1Q18_015682, partial [Sarracenia purpurea var. burkii]
ARITLADDEMGKCIFDKRRKPSKIIGTIVSILGALALDLYAGPAVIRSSSSPSHASSNEFLGSSQSEWIKEMEP